MPATDTPRLKLAVIGAGMASAPHWRSLADLHDQVELSWVGALTPRRLQGLPLPDGARTTTRLDDIFEDRSTQAVLLLHRRTPTWNWRNVPRVQASMC